jgi:hypothetical protein
MIKKSLSFAIICLLLVTANFSVISAQTKTGNDDSSVAKVKADVAKRGTGEKNRVEVKMLDGKKWKGYISQAGEDSFTLIDSNTGQSVSINYADVAKVKKAGPKGDTVALWIIGGAAAVGAIILGTALITRCKNEGGC